MLLVAMMLECSPGESLATAAFMHHDNKGNNVLKHYVALKGVTAGIMGLIGHTTLVTALQHYDSALRYIGLYLVTRQEE